MTWILGGGTSQVEFVQIDVTSLNPIIIIKQVNRLHKLITERNIDIVHCHHRMAALYMRAYRAFYRIPMVYTLHLADVPSDFFHRTMTYVGDKAIGVSTEVSTFLMERLGIPKDKVVTICNGVDESLLSPLTEKERADIKKEWGIVEQDFIFAMHSRIEKVKNHMLVVDAVKQLPEEIKNKIKIICSGSKKGI